VAKTLVLHCSLYMGCSNVIGMSTKPHRNVLWLDLRDVNEKRGKIQSSEKA